MSNKKMEELLKRQLDITAPHMVHVGVSADRKVLWVNVDGICVLRVCQIPYLRIEQPTSGA